MNKLTAVVVGLALCIIAGQAFGLQLSGDATISNINAVNISTRPLCFTENVGQFGEKTLYKAETGGAAFYFCRDEVACLFVRNTDELLDDSRDDQSDALSLPDKFNHPRYKQEAMLVKAEFMGSNQHVSVEGTGRLPHNNNYFIGNDHSQWHTDVANYAMVTYHDIYPGIDLKYYGDNRSMKYDFLVSPGADISQIRIHYEGVSDLSVTPAGDLQAQTEFGLVYEKVPYIYQEIAGTKRAVSGRYELVEPGVFGFAVDEAYDPNRPLVIDPELVYSTYIGSQYADFGADIAVDADGYAYIVGKSLSPNFPVVRPLYENFAGGYFDAVVLKMNRYGNSLVYSTYLGGSDADEGLGIAVDESGQVYLTGNTSSPDFPTANAYSGTLNGEMDAWVAKLSSLGDELLYSTYLGGEMYEETGNAIAADADGNAYVVGTTGATDFPTVNAFSNSNSGYVDVFVTKFSSAGDELIFSTYLGGYIRDYGYGIDVDSDRNVVVTGATNSPDFPLQNPYDSNLHAIFITKIASTGNSLIFSTFLGGNCGDQAGDIAVGNDNCVYVTGSTCSSDFPLVNPFDDYLYAQPGRNDIDAFVTKFNPTGDTILYSTYVGGPWYEGQVDPEEKAYSISVDADGYAYICGTTQSIGFPCVNPVFPNYIGGEYDAFVCKLEPTGDQMAFSTYLGGTYSEWAFGIANDQEGNAYVTGYTYSFDYPYFNGIDSVLNGDDIILTKIGTYIPPDPGTISGLILNEDLDPIEGATIRIDRINESTSSDETGHFAFASLFPAIRNLLVIHPDYQDTLVDYITINPAETTQVEIVMRYGGAIAGTITDPDFNPLEGVSAEVINTYTAGASLGDGSYFLNGLASGDYSLRFVKPYFDTTIVDNVNIAGRDTMNLDIVMEPNQSYVNIWYGNQDLSPIAAPVGGQANIDVYAQTSNAAVFDIFMALAVSDDYFDCYTNQPAVNFYYPLSEWDIVNVFGPFNQSPSPQGYSSMGVIAWAWVDNQPAPYLMSDTPIRIMSYNIDVINDPQFIGDTVECLTSGSPEIEANLPLLGDTLGELYYPAYEYFSPVTFVEPTGFAYLPGDANMPMAGWPPTVIGSDVTYMINYFRNLDSNPPCNFMGFYAPADINGDCRVIGSDVTRLVSYFRGQGTILYCPDYEPLWHSPQELPENPPPNWPGCE